MKTSKSIISLLSVSLFFLCSCGEVKEGADKVAGEVTGERAIKQGKDAKSQIKSLTEQHNKKQQDALDSLKK